ncbi:MAG: response regulator [bacterium]|nr:response regulator [bacterium]
MFLIDVAGNILFSVAAESDLGTNILTGPYSDTLFARACEQALATRRPVFSDLERYAPSDHDVAGFLVAVVVDDHGEVNGLLALQVPMAPIDAIMQDRAGLGQTGETYLVGRDLRMRSSSSLSGGPSILGEPVDTAQTRRWLAEHGEPTGETRAAEQMLIYDGPRGRQVLGIHTHLDIGGVPLGVLAEVETAEAFAAAVRLRRLATALVAVTALVIFMVASPVSRRMVRPLLELSQVARLVAVGDLAQEITASADNEIGELAESFQTMLAGLRQARQEGQARDWLKAGAVELHRLMRGEQDVATLASTIITFLTEYLGAQVGALYLTDEKQRLVLTAGHALDKLQGVAGELELGQGVLGQAALARRCVVLDDLPRGYLAVRSGLGEATPRSVVILPLCHEDEVKGVIELASLATFDALHQELLDLIAESVAITIHVAQSRDQLQELLSRSQEQTEKLQVSEEELSATNEELIAYTDKLQLSESRLKEQQEELQQINEELEERTQSLEREQSLVTKKNRELEKVGKTLEDRAAELAMASRHKSEFLANMSHELRTPLNSMLILGELLQENKDGNLTDKQMEFAATIHGAGVDLLNLIDEILDLSKIEAGRLDLHVTRVDLGDLLADLERELTPVARDQGLAFDLSISSGVPAELETDRQRLGQILKNLLSNAFKFTRRGRVSVTVDRPDPATLDPPSAIPKPLRIAVADTGIGIPRDQQRTVFEAFRQADGTTSRKYGGTGLGLAICRELTQLLGGELRLESEEGRGSCFFLLLPDRLGAGTDQPTAAEPSPNDAVLAEAEQPARQEAATETVEAITDDRREIGKGDKTVLIIEDDAVFAQILSELAHQHGFKCLTAQDGERGLELARTYLPSAIVLDILLPGMSGMAVLESMKSGIETRHIPVHVISAFDRGLDVLRMGAVGFLHKPVDAKQVNNALSRIESLLSRRLRHVLVVEDDASTRTAIGELIGNECVEMTTAATGKGAIEQLAAHRFDCVVLDLGLPDMDGAEVLERIRVEPSLSQLPVIVFTGKQLTADELAILDRYASSIIVKGAGSRERLLDETTLFLHRVGQDLPEAQRRMIRMVHDKETIFKGKRVLIVDDDMRNVFALSAVLEQKGLKVLMAENGREALAALNKDPGIDLILMDVMMPEMDGYEAMQRIRRQERFERTPIIALTAKAMKSDRGKCIACGANDYMSKPVEIERLVSMMRVWLYQKG